MSPPSSPSPSRETLPLLMNPPAYSKFERSEVTRILLQALLELGYPQAAQSLSKETGLCTDPEDHVHQVERYLVTGEYDAALRGVDVITYVGRTSLSQAVASSDIVLFIRFLIHRLHFLEVLIHHRQEAKALKILRHDISGTPFVVPIALNGSALPDCETLIGALESLMLNPGSDSQRAQAGWNGSLQTTRRTTADLILEFVTPEDVLPAGRLAALLTDAMRWKQAQVFNLEPPPSTTNTASFSLLHPPTTPAPFPATLKHTLRHHASEVWFVKFSPSGRYLASAGLDATIIIYDVEAAFTVVARLTGSQSEQGDASVGSETATGTRWPAPTRPTPIASRSWPAPTPADGAGNTLSAVMGISWSWDERYLLTCGMESFVKLWDMSPLAHGPVQCIKEFHISPHGRIFSVAFLPHDPAYHFVIASPDRVTRLYSTLNPEPIYEWPKQHRIDDITFSKDGSRLAMVSHDHQLFVYGINHLLLASGLPCTADAFPLLATIPLGHRVTSVTWSITSDDEILVSISPNELQLWSIRHLSTPFLVQRYLGHKHETHILHSAFGNWNESVVMTGDERGRIFFWDRATGAVVHLVGELEHLKLLVNCVDWNVNGRGTGCVWASAGDDGTVKIWGGKN